MCVFFSFSLSIFHNCLFDFQRDYKMKAPNQTGTIYLHLTRSSSVQGWMCVLLTVHKHTRQIIFELSLLVYLKMRKVLKICWKALRIEYALSHIRQQINESAFLFVIVFFLSLALSFFFYSKVVQRLHIYIYINIMHAHISVTRTLIDVIKKRIRAR